MQTNERVNAVEEARNKIETIKAGIFNGDKKLTANDLASAQNELAFSELQAEAKRRAEEKALNETRKSNLLKLQETLSAIADTRPAIDKKYAAFEKSFTDYLESVASYQKQLAEIRQELGNGGFLDGQMPGPIEGINTSDGREVAIGDVAASSLEPRGTIRTLVDRLSGEYFGDRVR